VKSCNFAADFKIGFDMIKIFRKVKDFFSRFFSQTAHPKGLQGRIMLWMMNFGHAPLTNWGLSHVTFQDGWTMLDIGCGGGATLKRLLKRSKNARVYGIDISEESIAKARKVNENKIGKQVFLELGSAEALPYENEKFDLVTAVETVYFWPRLPHCLQEVLRVLRPGAQMVIILEVIDGETVWSKVIDGMTVYSPENLKEMLDAAGFTETQVYRTKPSYATIIGRKP